MQTVNEARYTYWHTIIEIWQASGKTREEWCWENKIPLRTFIHYEGIFRRQKARGYVYRKPVTENDTTESAQLPESEEMKTESAFVEIPVMDDLPEAEEAAKRGSGFTRGSNKAKQQRVMEPVRSDKPELVIQSGGCRLTLGGEITESTLRSILKAVSGDA